MPRYPMIVMAVTAALAVNEVIVAPAFNAVPGSGVVKTVGRAGANAVITIGTATKQFIRKVTVRIRPTASSSPPNIQTVLGVHLRL